MKKSRMVITDPDQDAVDCVASVNGIGRSPTIDGAVMEAANCSTTFYALVQDGIDDLDAGRTVSNEEVMAELDAMIAKHQARCSA